MRTKDYLFLPGINKSHIMRKKIFFVILCHIFAFVKAQTTYQAISQTSFNSALSSASSGDIIEWQDGTYSNIYMNITKSGVTVKAETAGGVIFNGTSRVEIDGDNVTFSGLQFVGGDIVDGSTSTIPQTVITIDGSNVLVTNVNVSQYSCWKYLRIRDVSQNTEISYCNFEDRPNYADQNIVQVDVSSSQAGYHHIHHCSFKNFTGISTGGDDGVEPIRIGASSQSTYSSKTVVEYNYFTGCEGDGEIISHKATDCIYRYNTFEGNVKSELVLRHGDNGIVYGNFFVNGGRGIRIREGSGHLVFNNYFENLNSKSIHLNNSESDAVVQNVVIANNTIKNCDRFRLSDGTLDSGEEYPTNITLINNIFSDPESSSGLFRDATGNETWIGNIADSSGDMGITLPASGITYTSPQLTLNANGLYDITSTSPAINASTDNAVFPFTTANTDANYTYDNTLVLDVIKATRPSTVTMKDVGCQEYSASNILSRHVTEDNTGTDYEIFVLSSNDQQIIDSNFTVYPNPLIDNLVNISFTIDKETAVKVTIYDLSGKKITTIVDDIYNVGSFTINKEVNLVSGIYALQIEYNFGGKTVTGVEKLIKK